MNIRVGHVKSTTMIWVIAAICVLAVLCSAKPAAAQNNTGAAMPIGSYMNSCWQVSYGPMNENVPGLGANPVGLTASCDALDTETSSILGLFPLGFTHNCTEVGPHYGYCPATLFAQFCQPGVDIAAINGNLNCIAKTGTWGWGGAIPGGSYLNSCLNAHVLNGKLGADCPDSAGTYHHSVLGPLTECVMWSSTGGGIQNFSGKLVCSPNPNPPQASAPPPNPAPAPTPQPVITAYQQGISQGILLQLARLACTVHGATVNCASFKGYQLCEGSLKGGALIGIKSCTANGNVAQDSASADKLLVGAGCTRDMGRIGEYLCPVTGGAMALCNSMRSKGSVSYCAADKSDAAFTAADTQLLENGCEYFLGRQGQYMCPVSALGECNAFLKAGSVLSCKGNGK